MVSTITITIDDEPQPTILAADIIRQVADSNNYRIEKQYLKDIMKQIVQFAEQGQYFLHAGIQYSRENWMCLNSMYVRDVLRDNGFKVDIESGPYYNQSYTVSWEKKI